MSRICRIVIWVFAALYLMALGLLVIGTFGLFGQPQDPLSGIFLMPLGVPWNILPIALPDRFLLWLAVLAPALNLIILRALCGWLGKIRR